MDWIQGLRSGLMQALRGIRRAPGFAAAVVLTLGLGIGANATMFGVIDRLLLRPPDQIEAPEELRLVWLERVQLPGRPPYLGRALTWPDIQDMQEVTAFASVAAWSQGNDMTVGDPPNTSRITTTVASAEFFPMVGARPFLGRFFSAEEDVPGATGTVVLSYEYWQREFGGERSVLGEVLHLGRDYYEIIGVTEPGFTGLSLSRSDVWLPLWPAGTSLMGDSWHNSRSWWWLTAAVRLAPGATDEVAAAQATSVHRAARADVPGYDPDARIELSSVIEGRGPSPSDEARIAGWLGGVALLVLLVACANVANLFLVRVLRLRRELALKMALGSSARRMVSHFLSEGLTLAFLAAVAAVGIAVVGSRLLFAVLLPEVEPGAIAGIRLFFFTAGVATLAALLAGVGPAIRASRSDPAPELRDGSRGVAGSSSRLREALVMSQAGLSAVLLVGAGLFVTSLTEVGSLDLGYDADRVVYVQVEQDRTASSTQGAGIIDGDDGVRPMDLIYEEIEETLVRLPGVESAARAVTMPFGLRFNLSVRLPGQDSAVSHPSGAPIASAVAPGFFATMGQQLLQGREFEQSDVGAAAEPVVVVNEVLADHAWPGGEGLGSCVHIEGADDCHRVVGIVERHTQSELGEEPRPAFWVPIHSPALSGVSGVAVRTVGPTSEQLDLIRREVIALDPSIRFVTLLPMSDEIGSEARSWRLGASLFGAFGLLAVLVAGIGLYGLLSFEVARRRFEFGIRRALGASEDKLVARVIFQAIRSVLVGAGVGLLVAALAAPRLAPLLFQTSPRDPTVFLSAGLILLATSLAAAGLPAARAARVDPMKALKME